MTKKTCDKICTYLHKVQFKFSDFLYKAYVVGTHLNCTDKSMQFKWVPTTHAFIENLTKSTPAVI